MPPDRLTAIEDALGELAATVDDGATKTKDALTELRRSIDGHITAEAPLLQWHNEHRAEVERRLADVTAERDRLRAEAAETGRRTLGLLDRAAGRPGRAASLVVALLVLALTAREVFTVPDATLTAGTAEVLHALATRIAGATP